MHKEIGWLLSLERFGWKLSLERMEKAMELLGNPHLSYKTIHVTGTNGKGSTCAMIAQILKEAGYKSGLYTSPHLVTVNERYKINGKDISDAALVKLIKRIRTLGIEMTCFEFMTAIAFQYFKEQKVDYAVIEVGLGGRFDATNVIRPIVTVITNVSLEHEDVLGKGIERISFEKSGIIKEHVPLFTSEENALIKKICREKNSPFTICEKSPYPVCLRGSFQPGNAGIAVAACRFLNVSEEHIRRGLLETAWPCRLQFLEKNIIIDAAHNPAAMKALCDDIRTLDYRRLFVIFSCLKDKDYQGMLSYLPAYHKLIIAKIDYYRAQEPAVIKDGLKDAIIVEDSSTAFQLARKELQDDDLLLVCGSIYLAGEILKSYK